MMMMGGGALALAGAPAGWLGLRQMGSLAEFNVSVADTRRALQPAPDIQDLIRYATLAANNHNTQPWRFKPGPDGIDILPDLTRQLTAVDPDNHHLFASLGCAAENLAIASGMGSKPGALSYDPENGGAVKFVFGAGSSEEPEFFEAIPRRQSTRGDYDGSAVSSAGMQSLSRAAALPGVDMVLITDRPEMNRIRDLVVAGNTAQMADGAFVRELKSWLRFNPRQSSLRVTGCSAPQPAIRICQTGLGPSCLI